MIAATEIGFVRMRVSKVVGLNDGDHFCEFVVLVRMAALGGLTSPDDRVPGAARRGLVGDERGTPRFGYLTDPG